MAENSKDKSKRELLLERMKGKYPDMDFSDEEVLSGRINDDYDKYDKDLGELEDLRAREKEIYDLYSKDPRAGVFLSNWAKGGDPAVELTRIYGDDFMEALQDPEKQEALAEANKEFAKRVAKEKGYEEEYNKNLNETLSTLDKMQQEQGLSDEDIDQAMEFLVGVMKDGVLGKFSPESIKMALNATKHDQDVEAAAQEAEVRGRNAKIETKLRHLKSGDGIVPFSGGSARGERKEENPATKGALDRYKGNTTIWERGGEKRISRRY